MQVGWSPLIRGSLPLTRATLVEALRGRHSASLTGVGFLDDHALLAPGDASSSYSQSSEALGHHYLGHVLESWAFAFHNACWELLLDQLAAEPAHVVQPLFDLLYCLPSNPFSVTVQAHDYGGAATIWGTHTDLPLPLDWRFLHADPAALDYASSPSSCIGLAADSIRIVRSDASSRDWFARLPPELIHLIATVAASPDLCSLRLSSPAVANLTSPTDLPQSFWKSRFTIEPEMRFALSVAATLDHGNDWQGLFFHVKSRLQDTSLSGHLRNRARIWQSLRHITDCIVPLLDQGLSRQLGTWEESLKTKGYSLGHVVRGHERTDQDMAGHRLFGTTCALFDPEDESGAPTLIAISFLTFDCTKYMCGLRLLHHDGARETELSRAGLVLVYSKTALTIVRGCLSGIRVATAVSGVVGIAFCFQGETETTLEAGIVHQLPQGVGVATLRPRRGHRFLGIAIGFDVRLNLPYFLARTLTAVRPVHLFQFSSSSDVITSRHVWTRVEVSQRTLTFIIRRSQFQRKVTPSSLTNALHPILGQVFGFIWTSGHQMGRGCLHSHESWRTTATAATQFGDLPSSMSTVLLSHSATMSSHTTPQRAGAV